MLNLLNICFLHEDNNRRADIFYVRENEFFGSEVVFVSILVFLPLELIDSGSKINYFYFFKLQKENNQAIIEENNLLLNKKLRFLNPENLYHFDGLVWFNTIDEQKVKKMKTELITYHLERIFDVLQENAFNEHNFFLSLVKTLKESLCADSDYDELFHKVCTHQV